MTTHWKSFVWLLRREIWEHKGSMVWAPLVVSGVAAAMVALLVRQAYWFVEHNNSLHIAYMADPFSLMGPMQFVFYVMAFISTFYCINTLADERQDRSVLFWQSLPVSDGVTVWSKVATATVVAPLLNIAAVLVVSILVYVGTIFATLVFPNVVLQQHLLQSRYALAPFQVLSLLPVYALWALPSVGWFMLVSSTVRSKPFVWAFGLPILSGGLLLWINRSLEGQLDVLQNGFWDNVVGRSLMSLAPGTWLRFGDGKSVAPHDFSLYLLQQSWSMLTTPALWAGVVAGIVMITMAVRLRRWPLGS